MRIPRRKPRHHYAEDRSEEISPAPGQAGEEPDEQRNAEAVVEPAIVSPANLPAELAVLSVEEWADKYVRLLADFDNFRKRSREEAERRAQAQKNAFIVDLLGVVDNFERALDAAAGSDSVLAEGMRAIDRQMRDLLAAHGVEPIDALGKPFDPFYHEAAALSEDPDIVPGTVCAVIQGGWMRDGEVLRHARVVVGKE